MNLFPAKESRLTGREAELELNTVLTDILPDLLKGFYDWIMETPDLRQILMANLHGKTVPQVVDHLSTAQMHHWTTRLAEGANEAYFARSRLIGQTHMRIGLNVDFFVQGYMYILAHGTERLWEKTRRDAGKRLSILVAFENLVLADLNNIAQAYNTALSDAAAENLHKVSDDIRHQVGSSVSTIASATEELSSTAASITREIGHSSEKTDEAVEKSAVAEAAANELAGLAENINKIVEFIRGFSEQINLLALNASIEAARAGDSGRGFAVVADEVKKLASETAVAARQIREQVELITASTSSVRGGIVSLGMNIRSMQEMIHNISNMMREQAIATHDISSHASDLTASINDFIEKLRKG